MRSIEGGDRRSRSISQSKWILLHRKTKGDTQKTIETNKKTLRKLPVDGSLEAPSPRPQSSLCHRRVHRLQRFARNIQPCDRRALQMVLDWPVQACLESPQQLSTIRRRLRLALRILQVLIIYLLENYQALLWPYILPSPCRASPHVCVHILKGRA